jgi:hypothetical protein
VVLLVRAACFLSCIQSALCFSRYSCLYPSSSTCSYPCLDAALSATKTQYQVYNKAVDGLVHKPATVSTKKITSTTRTTTTRKSMAQLRLLYQSVEKIMPLELEQQQKQQQQMLGMQGSQSGLLLRLVVPALESLVKAKTSQQVIQAGRHLQETVNVALPLFRSQQIKVQVLERIAKAAAITGLFHVAINVTQHHVPSHICQEAFAWDFVREEKRTPCNSFFYKWQGWLLLQNHKLTTTTLSVPWPTIYSWRHCVTH